METKKPKLWVIENCTKCQCWTKHDLQHNCLACKTKGNPAPAKTLAYVPGGW